MYASKSKRVDSSWVGLEDIHFSRWKMEFHWLQDSMSVLVLSNSLMKSVLRGAALLHSTQVWYFPEHHDAVSEEEPPESSRRSFEDFAHIEQTLGSWSRHQVHKQKGIWVTLLEHEVRVVVCQEFRVICSLLLFALRSLSVHILVWEWFGCKVVHLQNFVDVVFDTLAKFLWAFHIIYQ